MAPPAPLKGPQEGRESPVGGFGGRMGRRRRRGGRTEAKPEQPSLPGEADQAAARSEEGSEKWERESKSPMATSGEQMTLGQLGQEATCPLCLDFFKQPMVLSCGHNFCRDCLVQLSTEFSCPQCRARVELGSACPNWALANIVCHLKRLRLSEGTQEESNGQLLCREHGQPMQIFCSSEKSLLCPCCLVGHQGHPLLSVPEAARQYKVLLDGLLETLRKEEQKLLEQRQAQERIWQECQEEFAAEKQKVGLALESLQEVLRERQLVWLAWLAEQKEKMEAKWWIPRAQLSGEDFRLQQLMAQTERKCCQPDGEFLQDIQDTVHRCQSYVVGRVESVSPRLQGRLQTLLDKNASLRQLVDHYKASLQPTLIRENLEQFLTTVFVTMNSSSAHPLLQTWERSILSLGSRYQKCPDVPERFDKEFCILGCEGFTTGLHWWDVNVFEAANAPVWGKARWAVGVARESVRRKGSFQMSPQEGIWAVGRNVKRKIVAFSKDQQRLRLQRPLQKLRVRLDYEAEKVEILDASTEISLYTFWTGPFHGETLRPFFYLGQKGATLLCRFPPFF